MVSSLTREVVGVAVVRIDACARATAFELFGERSGLNCGLEGAPYVIANKKAVPKNVECSVQNS